MRLDRSRCHRQWGTELLFVEDQAIPVRRTIRETGRASLALKLLQRKKSSGDLRRERRRQDQNQMAWIQLANGFQMRPGNHCFSLGRLEAKTSSITPHQAVAPPGLRMAKPAQLKGQVVDRRVKAEQTRQRDEGPSHRARRLIAPQESNRQRRD